MEKQKERIVFFCTIIGGIADFIALFTLKPENSIPFIIISLLLMFCVVVYLFYRYKERCDFLYFVEHLFDNKDNKFTLLPKICMALDSVKERKDLHITEMVIRHNYDFRTTNLQTVTKDTRISYNGNIEYHINAKNKQVPDEFSCYLGDIYSDPTFSISQKHGCQSDYENVPVPPKVNDEGVASAVTRVCWQLKKQNITQSKTLPISFILRHSGTTSANSDHTLVFYPKQFGKTIDKVKFEVCFYCEKDVLKRAEFFRIWRDGDEYKHTPISGVDISDNKAVISFEPYSTGYEAYYFRVYFELT